MLLPLIGTMFDVEVHGPRVKADGAVNLKRGVFFGFLRARLRRGGFHPLYVGQMVTNFNEIGHGNYIN